MMNIFFLFATPFSVISMSGRELGSGEEEYLPANYTNLRERDKAVCRFGFTDPASSLVQHEEVNF
jgi:hypothetical protein